MREIKFRGKLKDGFLYGDLMQHKPFTELRSYIKPKYTGPMTWDQVDPNTVGQYTGKKDKNDKEIYEGDIFRVEEDDMIYYLVIVWVEEWCMFCTLRVDDEYPEYLSGGVEALDEPMFWTYTLQDTDSRKFYLCGDIHTTPHLLKRKSL